VRRPLRDEPVGDATLIEYLDRARVQTAGARTGDGLAFRRSTTRPSTSWPASISPVGPPPAITAACSVRVTPLIRARA